MSIKSNPAFTMDCGCIYHNGTVIQCQEHKVTSATPPNKKEKR